MNISMQVAVVVAAVCLCLADGAPDGRLVRTKQQRPTRGFKNVEMMTARGFGKRDRPHTRAELLDTEDFLEILGSAPEKDTMENNDDKTTDSIPVELFVMEMLNHPEFARLVVSKFLDVNQDGILSLEELLRNTA